MERSFFFSWLNCFCGPENEGFRPLKVGTNLPSMNFQGIFVSFQGGILMYSLSFSNSQGAICFLYKMETHAFGMFQNSGYVLPTIFLPQNASFRGP